MKKIAKWASIAFLTLSLSYIALLVVVEFSKPQPQATQAVVQPVAPPVVYVEPEPPTIDELLNAVNAERAKVGVKPLRLDPLLNKSAQIKADDMFTEGRYEHVDLEGKHGYEYVAEVGKVCEPPGENLVWNKLDTLTTEQAMSWWASSQPHYKAMVNPIYDSTGFGISDKRIVVQHFCNE